MKQLVQSCLGTVGLRLARLQYVPRPPLHDFFSMLKQRGFEPAHIVDVGANHGNWTRAALKFFPAAYYTLIEPQDNLKTYVQDLVGGDGKIRWIGMGAADKSGTLPFTISHRDDSSNFYTTPDAAKGSGQLQIDVPVATLNEIVRASRLPFPDMVKIDAEGFDLKVLAGASELVGKTDVFLLEAAICAPGIENTLVKVLEAMVQAGYRAVDITDLNRSRYGVLWLCEVAFLRRDSHLLNGDVSYE